jgi:hypothetical protein
VGANRAEIQNAGSRVGVHVGARLDAGHRRRGRSSRRHPRHSSPAAFWLIFGCVGGVMPAIAVENAHEKRELNTAEAITRGLLY